MTREKQIREAAWMASMTEETIVRDNNDVGHCMGIDCPRKDECYRHWLYQEMHKHEGGAWVIQNGMWNNKECEDFIKLY